MSYADSDDLDIAFGRANVRKWADIENNGVDTDIAARITWALDTATALMDDKLRKSPAQFPLTGDIPASVALHCAYLAGSLLYDSRGVTDFDADGRPINQLSWAKKACDKFITDIYARLVVLDVEPAIEISEAPFFIDAFAETADDGELDLGLEGWEEP